MFLLTALTDLRRLQSANKRISGNAVTRLAYCVCMSFFRQNRQKANTTPARQADFNSLYNPSIMTMNIKRLFLKPATAQYRLLR